MVCVEQTGYNDYWGIINTYPINYILKRCIWGLENMLRNVMEEEEKSGKIFTPREIEENNLSTICDSY